MRGAAIWDVIKVVGADASAPSSDNGVEGCGSEVIRLCPEEVRSGVQKRSDGKWRAPLDVLPGVGTGDICGEGSGEVRFREEDCGLFESEKLGEGASAEDNGGEVMG